MKKIVFVCTGNTCRSPMAMAFFNSLIIPEPPEFDFTAVSAGLAVSRELLPSENAVHVMRDSFSIDITGHRAGLLTHDLVEEAYVLLTMTENHKHYILSMYPEAHHRVFTLKEFAYGLQEHSGGGKRDSSSGISMDISDPYGGSVWTYKLCAEEILQAVERVVEKLKKN